AFLDAERGIGDAKHIAGGGSDFIAGLALVHHRQRGLRTIAEDDADIVEGDCRAHAPSPASELRNMRSRMIARMTMQRPDSKPFATLTLFSARPTGTPSPAAPTRAEMTTIDSDSMIVWVSPAMICAMAK